MSPSDSALPTSAGPPHARGGKLIVMWALLAAIPVLATVMMILGYYAIGKLTYSVHVCGSFARIDPEIGWTLAPSATSCLSGRSPFSTSPPWFESSVYIDANGFRSTHPGGDTPVGGVMMIGDSFTFGYGVDFEQSFAGKFRTLSGIPVVDVASPAYSSAQALLLAERWIGRLRPRALVVLEIGQWQRAACRGRNRPRAILKPCYWQFSNHDAELVLPPPGRVARWAAAGIVPGGMIGAGEITWTYFLLSRPVLQAETLAVRLGLISGFAHDYAAVGVNEEAIRLAAARHIGRLADMSQVPVILLDPDDLMVAVQSDALPPSRRRTIHRIGKSQWDEQVVAPLPPGERTLANDGHFSVATHRLVADLILRELRKLALIN